MGAAIMLMRQRGANMDYQVPVKQSFGTSDVEGYQHQQEALPAL
jgi:hypothetical protein